MKQPQSPRPRSHCWHIVQGPDCPLRTRLLLHCAVKLEGAVGITPSDTAGWEVQLGAGGVDDQLSLAAALYARADFAAAAAVYEGLLGRFPDLHALRVYLALCAYMQDGAPPDGAACVCYPLACFMSVTVVRQAPPPLPRVPQLWT